MGDILFGIYVNTRSYAQIHNIDQFQMFWNQKKKYYDGFIATLILKHVMSKLLQV